jgi:hypothetical protein
MSQKEFIKSTKSTKTGFPIDKKGVPRDLWGANLLTSFRKSKTRK